MNQDRSFCDRVQMEAEKTKEYRKEVQKLSMIYQEMT
jgi:hypothetical protein